MLGGPPPPILVITGSARAQAAAQLRNLLDPVAQPVHPLPYSTRALGQLALSNKVLAFSIGGRLTKAKQSAFNDLQDGMLVKLKEANKRRQAISTTLARAIILSAATKIEVHPHQFTIEVNQASESTQSGELFSALLSAMVKFLRLLRDHAEHHGLQLALPPPTAFHPVEFSDAPAP